MKSNTSPESLESRAVSPLFVFACMLVTMGSIGFIVYRRTSKFTTGDRLVAIQYITPQKMQEFGGMPSSMDVGLCINNFRTFDIIKNDFVFDGVLWFEFDPSHISLSTVEQFSFDRGEILYRSAPVTQVKEGRLFVRYDVRLRFSGEMNYRRFPVDDHRLAIVLINKTVSPNELIFKSRNANFVVIPNMKIVGWSEFRHDVEVGYIETRYTESSDARPLQYPAAAFTIDYGRQSNIRNIIIVVLPMLLLFFVSLFSLALDPSKWFTAIISIPIQGIIGLLAYRFVLEAMSPAVGYFMYSDIFFFGFLFFMFCILLLHTAGFNLGAFVRKIIIVLLCIVVLAMFLYFLWR